MNKQDVYALDEKALKRECAFALCPPKQATASSFYNTLDGVMRRVREWCVENSRGCNLIGFCLVWDGGDDVRKMHYFATVGHEDAPPMGEAMGASFHLALMRAALMAVLALEEEEKRNKS